MTDRTIFVNGKIRCDWCGRRWVWPWQTPSRHQAIHSALFDRWLLEQREALIDRTISNLIREDAMCDD